MPSRLRGSAAALALTTTSFGVSGAAAPAALASGGSFFTSANTARAQQGLRAYSQAGDLDSVAQSWATWMARHRTLAHNPSLASQVCCWSGVGENVGEGSSASAIQRAFMASAEHRGNILSTRFTQMGVGAARGSDGKLYVDEVFRRPAAAPSRSGPRFVVRPRAVRVSRDSVRIPRAGQTAALVRDRLLAWRREAARLRTADPVSSALTFWRAVQQMRVAATL